MTRVSVYLPGDGWGCSRKVAVTSTVDPCRQFHIGDQIVGKDFEGTVEKIELRALFLRTYDKRLVIIPNGDVFTRFIPGGPLPLGRGGMVSLPSAGEFNASENNRLH